MCPVDHDAIKLDEHAWSLLRYRGIQDAFDEEGTHLELRNCACGSTLCRTLKAPPLHIHYRRARGAGVDMYEAFVYALGRAANALLNSFSKGS